VTVATMGVNPRLHDLLSRVKRVKRSGRGWSAPCPAHDDKSPSLSITEGRDGRIVLYCHAGCRPEAIVAAIGMEMRDLFAPDGTDTAGTPGMRAALAPVPPPAAAVEPPAPPPSNGMPPRIVATYDYVATDGALLFQAVRLEPKGFRQRRPDGRGGWTWSLGETAPVLYGLPDVLEAARAGRQIFIVEGEKDADALRELGYCATTSPMGAGKWRDEYAAALDGASVVVLPDNDAVGQAHAEAVAGSCFAREIPIKVVSLPNLPEKGDVSDWLNDGHDLDELDALVAAAPRWQPAGYVRTRWRLDELWEDDEVMRPPPPVVPRLAWAARSTLFASVEKSGKSTLLGYAAAAVSRGWPFMGEPCQRGVVLVLGLEEFIGDVARRLRQFDADATRVYLVDRLPPDPRERPAAVRAHIAATSPVLVIIDTFMAYGEGTIADANSSSQTQPVIQALTNLAHETGVAVVIVHHARKSDGKVRDSSAIPGGVDVVAEMFIPDEDADPSLRKVRTRGRVPVFGFEFRYDGRHILPVSDRTAPLDQRITEYVQSNPGASLRDIRSRVGGRAEDVDRTILTLLQAGRIANTGSERSHAYHVPASIPQSDLLTP
jgi:putative DNA primase/helicase